mmetsp:Transcript_52783/g.123070  ORF Transcript_52783/g.123070 Transcript_52783/m.123070 type:complete len:209 (-) Transcript_52783:104-730(-)
MEGDTFPSSTASVKRQSASSSPGHQPAPPGAGYFLRVRVLNRDVANRTKRRRRPNSGLSASLSSCKARQPVLESPPSPCRGSGRAGSCGPRPNEARKARISSPPHGTMTGRTSAYRRSFAQAAAAKRSSRRRSRRKPDSPSWSSVTSFGAKRRRSQSKVPSRAAARGASKTATGASTWRSHQAQKASTRSLQFEAGSLAEDDEEPPSW